ncbi:MAG: pyridoxal phosphate-dependent class II aminotransferase [Rubrobacter sp.]|nr:pyridoxal phosphate-dependent class II aminotransferase [Rubrobacter sp.]
MAEGWADHPGGRHHGAHSGLASRSMPTANRFLDFSQNVNPLGPPDGVLDAARNAVTDESGGYPDLGYPELRDALARYFGVSAETVLPTNGGAEALFLAARAASENPGRKAVVLEPTFSEYATAARTAGLEPVHRISRRPEDDFAFDVGVLEDLEDVAAVFLCNPNNPTGDALSRDEVMRVASTVRGAGATLILDEAFADFIPGVSVADGVEGQLCVARSLTKFFAIPGLRLGCLISTRTELAQSFQPSWPVNAPAAAAGTAAARDFEFVERSIATVGRLREDLAQSLGALPGIKVFPGAANFLLVRGPERMPGKLARRGILVRGCEPFRGLGPEFFRVAVRGEEENGRLIEALREEL